MSGIRGGRTAVECLWLVTLSKRSTWLKRRFGTNYNDGDDAGLEYDSGEDATIIRIINACIRVHVS